MSPRPAQRLVVNSGWSVRATDVISVTPVRVRRCRTSVTGAGIGRKYLQADATHLTAEGHRLAARLLPSVVAGSDIEAAALNLLTSGLSSCGDR